MNQTSWNTSVRIFVSKNDIKIKITLNRVRENGCIWKGISLMNACWVSQWVFYQDRVFKERRLKRLCYLLCTCEMLDTKLCQVQD